MAEDWDITPEIQKDIDRGLRALHAMQTGVALEMTRSDRASATTPKHLRVGVNSAMIQLTGLVRLLVAKGVFTPAEYWKYQADEAEREVERYEERNPGVKLV
jgi:hypothetical protein